MRSAPGTDVAEFRRRLEHWILATSVLEVKTALGLGSRTTVYNWLHGTKLPNGAIKAMVLERMAVWERERAGSGHGVGSS